MIIKSPVTTNLKIEKLEDLYKLKLFMESANLKINKSQIARELDVDRRTVDKYLHGFHKSGHRTSSNCLTPYKDIIRELLSDENEQIVTVQNPCLLQDDLSVPSKSSCQSFISADTVLPACANV